MNLDFTGYFITPVYSTMIPGWVKPLIKATDPFIKEAKDNNKINIKTRNNDLKKNIGDFGMSHHSRSLINSSSTAKLNGKMPIECCKLTAKRMQSRRLICGRH